MFGGDARTTHHDSDRFRQIVDPFSRNSRIWTLFTEWVCSLATTPPQTARSPPPIGGNDAIQSSDTPTTRQQPASHAAQPPPPPVRKVLRGRRERRRLYGLAATRRSRRRNLGNRKHGRCHGEIKVALHTPSHRMCGTKLALLSQNGQIWQVLRVHGDLSTVFATNKPRMANFVPHARQRRG